VRRASAILAVVLALAIAPAAGGGSRQPLRPPALTVMTRNIYVGANVERPVLVSHSRQDFERNVTLLWRTVRKTNFPARARLLAREVKRTRPDVIGLQEVALWRRGPSGVTDGPATPAHTVVYDFLALLQRRLRRAGLRYRVAAHQRNSDVEAPTTLGYDVRLTDRDVILVRRSRRIHIDRARARHFTARISVAVAGIPIRVVRGWVAVDLRVGDRRLRFVTTHLDPTLEPVRNAQVRELLGPHGPTRTHRPLILAGDLNTTPFGGTPPNAYRVLRTAGFLDTWVQRNGRRPGRSCCMRREDIMDPPPAPFNRRIDYILTKPRFRVLRTIIVGRDPRNRTGSGLWPSDHGGHVSRLRFRHR
jgi:endonuclease/exonuclease/phosphatase family metal-dependent hydrolase